jgi:hypothetical protein
MISVIVPVGNPAFSSHLPRNLRNGALRSLSVTLDFLFILPVLAQKKGETD